MKRVSIHIIFCFCFLSAYSQSIDSAFSFYDRGRYEKAALEFEKVLPLIEKMNGENDTVIYTLLLLYTGTSYEKENQYSKAEIYYTRTRSVYEKLGALSAPGYITATNKLAELYRITGKFESAEKLYLETLEKNEKLFGRESRNYINLLNSIGLLYQKTGINDKSEAFFKQALEISRKVYGEYDPDYALILNNITTLYHKTGNYGRAEPAYLKALDISIRTYGKEHPNTVTILNNLGALYDDMGNYEKAESFYIQVLQIREKVPGTDHSEYALPANNLAQLYFKTGNYDQAEVLYFQALDIYKKVYGDGHFSYAGTLNNLGALYHTMGRYDRAESFYTEALNIRKKVFGENHPAYATSLNNLALFYQETGNYEKAETYFEKSLEIRKNTLGEDHPDYATSLSNTALFYQERGSNDKAESLMLEALNIRKKSQGESHPDYAVGLNNIALLYSDMKDFGRAEPLFLQALAIIRNTEGESGAHYASTLNNLASLYSSTGDYKKAESMYLRSIRITGKLYGANHPDYASAASNLALLYQERGLENKAANMYQAAMKAYLSQIKQQFTFMSETEKEKYVARLEFFFRTFQNFIIQNLSENPESAGTAYDIELTFKGLLLNTNKQLRMNIFSRRDTGLINIYNKWITVRASLANQYSKPAGQQSSDITILEARADDLEKSIVRFLSGETILTGIQDIKWYNIKERLKQDEAAIEFTNFPVIDNMKWTNNIMYYAILLKNDEKYPLIVPLFEQSQLDNLLQKSPGSEMNYINDLYSMVNKKDSSLQGKGRQLYNLIWEPLEKYLSGIGTIFYTPSGTLHYLSFSAIPCGGKELLSDRYNLHQLTSTAQTNSLNKEDAATNITLYGGIEYDTSAEKMKEIARHYRPQGETEALNVNEGISLRSEYNLRGSWIYLDGTLSEIELIRKTAVSRGIRTVEFTGDEAVEESIKNLQGNNSPDILHIATHGFFFTDASKVNNAAQPYRLSDNPLVRAGLAFTGANHAWKGELIPPGLNDGILTAYEVSNMYIPNTDLVVLSACETGLGEIKGSEGVYGLQRSFKIAGADYILMSLWQIPDYQTSELMNNFYKEWFSGKSIYQSLKSARSFMKEKYPDQPFMWAAFVLIK